MTDINQIIDSAKRLGIKLTRAELGTEMCQAWCDRVEQAQMHWDRGEMAECRQMVTAANQYAID